MQLKNPCTLWVLVGILPSQNQSSILLFWILLVKKGTWGRNLHTLIGTASRPWTQIYSENIIDCQYLRMKIEILRVLLCLACQMTDIRRGRSIRTKGNTARKPFHDSRRKSHNAQSKPLSPSRETYSTQTTSLIPCTLLVLLREMCKVKPHKSGLINGRASRVVGPSRG